MYLVTYVTGESVELEADVYQRDGEDWLFMRQGTEVLRARAEDVSGITKSR